MGSMGCLAATATKSAADSCVHRELPRLIANVAYESTQELFM